MRSFLSRPEELKPFRCFDVKPVLLHGDFWPGNCMEIDGDQGVAIFDAGSHYGHCEHDLALYGIFAPNKEDEFIQAYWKARKDGAKPPGFSVRQTMYLQTLIFPAGRVERKR